MSKYLRYVFLHISLEHGYCPSFRNIIRPSERNKNSGTCIDNIFIKLYKINYKTFTLKIPLSDHFPIFMSINKIRATKDVHAMKRINYNKLRSEAELINCSELTLINEPKLALNKLVRKIKISIKKLNIIKNIVKRICRIQEKTAANCFSRMLSQRELIKYIK